jgi:hypothetical protein
MFGRSRIRLYLIVNEVMKLMFDSSYGAHKFQLQDGGLSDVMTLWVIMQI